jgi:tripartite-type tricarboxylate transporter receptor subunit TctC
VLAVAKDLPARTIPEYLKWAAANGDKAVIGSPAAGSPPHFFGLALAENAGIKLKLVAYDNSAALMDDLAGGKLVAAVDTLANVLARHHAGKVRILAVSGAKRSAMLPAVPTFTEEGLKDPGGEGWYAFFAPFSTPKVALERLSGSIRAALKSPEASAQLAKQGLEATGTQTYELRAIVHADYARWAPAARASGFTVLDTPNLLIH